MQGYWYAPGWQKYRQSLHQADASVTVKLAARQDADGTPATITAQPSSRVEDVDAKPQDVSKGVSVVLAYATVTSNTQQYAKAVAWLLGKAGHVKVSSYQGGCDSVHRTNRACPAQYDTAQQTTAQPVG